VGRPVGPVGGAHGTGPETGDDPAADAPFERQQHAAGLVDGGVGVVGGARAAEAVLEGRAVVVPRRPAGRAAGGPADVGGGGRHPGITGPGQGDDEVGDGAEGVGPGRPLVGRSGGETGGDEGVGVRLRRPGAAAHDLDMAAGGGVVGHVGRAVGGGPAEAAVAGQGQPPGAAAAGRALLALDAVVGGGELGRGGGDGRAAGGRRRGAAGGRDLVAVVAAPDDGHGAGGGHDEGHGGGGRPEVAEAAAAAAGASPGALPVEADRRGGRAGGSVDRGGSGVGGGPGGLGHGGFSSGKAGSEVGPERRAVLGNGETGQGGADGLVALGDVGAHGVSPSA